MPQTSRPTKSNYASKHHGGSKNVGGDHHPQGALTARPPTGEKGGRQHHRGNAVRPHHVAELKTPGAPDLPMTPAKALKNHRDQLSQYEQGEVLDYPQVCDQRSHTHCVGVSSVGLAPSPLAINLTVRLSRRFGT